MIPSRIASRHLLNVMRPAFVRASPAVMTKCRRLTTESVPAAEAGSIVAEQRRHRPVSPHLSIYKPQIPWILSITNRITGAVLSGGVYVFGAAYLASPLFGWHLDVPTLVATFGALPVAAKVGIKALVAFPFTFHSINGVRHMLWDIGTVLDNKAVIRTGWTVIGLTSISTIALALM